MDYLINKAFFYHQPKDGYHVNSDTIFLSSFLTMRHKDDVLDIGCGCGALMILAHYRFHPRSLTGIEINPVAVEYGLTNIRLNHIKASIILGKIQDHRPIDQYDVIMCNPPYYHRSRMQHERYQGRYDDALPLETLVEHMHRLLKPKGHAYLVYPVHGFNRVMRALSSYGLSIARMRYFHPRMEKDASIVALDIRHGTTMHCIVEKPWQNDDLIHFQNQLRFMDNINQGENFNE